MDNIREKQLEMLKILKYIDKICVGNNIKYSLAYGTALGAVRHKGFIPWDDDADIYMLWEDYIKFKDVWEKEKFNNNEYFLQNFESEKKYPMIYPKIRNKNISAKEKYFENIGIEEGVWVDIFIVINISDNAYIAKMQHLAITISNFLNHKYFYLSKNEFVMSNHKHVKLKCLFFKILPERIRRKISKALFDKACSVTKSKYVEDIAYRDVRERKYFKELIYVDFEDSKFPITKYYDSYLSGQYGDYMVPVKYSHDIIK